jgi:hypothetical protein
MLRGRSPWGLGGAVHHLITSRCKCLLILATKLPILGIILYRKGINPRGLIGTIGTHLQRDAPRWCIFARSLVRSRYLSVDVRSSMLLIGGRGTLDSVCIREDYTGLE